MGTISDFNAVGSKLRPQKNPANIISGVLTVGVGAISGGLTNAVAIWMLRNNFV